MSGGAGAAERYVHGSNAAADDPLVWYENATLTNKHWLHADHLGSIVASTDSAGSHPTINTYDEYGIPGSQNEGRFQYTGQAWIPELGMYYYKARIYSPTLGRFLQTDPIGYKDQVNLYAYVGDDPVNAVDPTGTDTWAQTIKSAAWDFVEPLTHIPGDLADAGRHIRAGDLEYFRDLPPTLSGGAGAVRGMGSLVTAARALTFAKAEARLADRGAKLASELGKSRVIIDLIGESHFSKELGRNVNTPHIQYFQQNFVNGVLKSEQLLRDKTYPATKRMLDEAEKVIRNANQ